MFRSEDSKSGETHLWLVSTNFTDVHRATGTLGDLTHNLLTTDLPLSWASVIT